MFDNRRVQGCSYLLAKIIFAGSVFLCSSGNVIADANLATLSAFASADAARANTYMDTAGTWNGANEVTNTIGDTFVFTVDNQAAGLPADDTAFDLAVSIEVGSNFRLPTSPFSVTVVESPLCPVFPVTTATQAGGAGTTISLNIPPDTDILPGCSYSFTFGLTANDSPPSVTDGFYDIDFDISYNIDDDDANTQTTQTQTEIVEVRTGEVALLKTAVTAIAADGDAVEFTVSLLGAGSGGIFDVVLTDILSSDLTGLIITPPVNPPGTPGPAANQYTFDYIAEGEVVDVTVMATVSVDPNAVSCPVLLNTADAMDRTGTTSNFFDAVPFDLLNPFIEYTPPDVTIPFGVAGIDVTIPVTNTGTGAAKNISISATNLAAYTVVLNNLASPNWSYAGGGIFNYTGTIAAGVTQSIVFNVSATSCPPPIDQNLNWIPAYQNACGTDFFPPLRFSTIAVGNTPAVDVTKTGSSGALNIGQPGSYTIALGGTNVANLPDDGLPTNQDFVVTDTLPFGITSAVINTVPPATSEILVNGLAYVTGSPIPDGAVITWRGDRADLTPLPSIQVDYIAGTAGLCPVGQTITNTATVDYASCAINVSDSAGFILNESPAGGAILNIAVGGDGSFETGSVDTDGVSRNEAREGEQIPFTVTYSFPAGFAGSWAGSSFVSELRSSEGAGAPLVLTNNRTDVHLLVSRISDGAIICNLDLNPATDFTGGDGTGALLIANFGSIAGCALPVNMENHNMVLTYAATSPEGDLDGSNNPLNENNVGGYLENTTLTVAGGPLSCLGTMDFIQAVNVNIERAILDLNVTINNGNPVSVCSVVPAALNVTGPALDTSTDNILLQFNDANFEFVDAAGNAGNENTDLVYGGSVAALGMSGSRVLSDILMTPALNTNAVTADGTVNFNVRLRDSAVPQILSAQLGFDSNHTSPDGSATDADRDYSIAVNGAPFAVLSGDLEMEFFPPDIILLDSLTYNFKTQVENVGTGMAVNAVYRITLPAGMRFDSAVPAPATAGPFNFTGQTIEWDLGDMAAGGIIDIDINTSINQTTCFQGVGEDIISENEWGCGSPIINTETDPPLVLAPTQLTLTHDPNNSFCELCNEGEVRLIVSNTGGVLLTDVVVTEDLRTSGLRYVAGSTTYLVDGVLMGPALIDPVPFGTDDRMVTWNATHIPELVNLFSAFSTAPNTPQEIEIVFRVERAPGFTEESLVAANRDIQASAAYGLFCGPPPQAATSLLFELPLEQPVPEIVLQGRNVDANQSATQYTDDVFGGAQDDVIWRLTLANDSAQARADLEDLLVNSLFSFVSETIAPPPDIAPNFNIAEVCNSEANATLAANGASPGAPDCISPGSANLPGSAISTAHDVDDPFGNPNNDEVAAFVDTLEGTQATVYFVGQFQTLCNITQADVDVEWGCEVDPGGAGGITAPGSNGGTAPNVIISDSQISGTDVNAGDIAVTHTITGSNVGQPLGSKGVLTIEITNNANGSVRNITLTDVLPAGYALDISQISNPGVSDVLVGSVVTTPLFGVYTGIIDIATVTNLNAVAFENNTSLDITLSSSTGVAPQNDLMRAGDVVQITINIVKISGFDIEADPDIEDENTVNGEDPTVVTGLTNQVSVDIRNTCGEFVGTVNPANLTVNPSPADLDITINSGDPNKTYVISNPADSLDLDVQVTNFGGHEANDQFIMVTVGSGLQVTGIPAACTSIVPLSPVSPPAVPRPVWDPSLPVTGETYTCDAGVTFQPLETRNYLFTVQKQGLGADLTFRADVVGEITLATGGAPLVYPAPVTNVITNVANNYSLDTIRARIIGFNLTKIVTDCREQGPLAALSQAANVQIGEDCTYHLSAGWFGFSSPGFGQIAIGNISIFDDVSAGQGYISQADTVTGAASGSVTAATFSSTPAAVVAPNEITQARWDYNAGANNITDNVNIDIDIVKRTRNDALDSSAAPNNHSAVTTDTLNVSFEVDFDGVGGQPPVVFSNGSANYPPLSDREVDITIAEPNLTISKQVCNESEVGSAPGAACLTFGNLVQGDVNDIYTYRIQITNTSPVATTASKPAFDVVVIDTLDLFSEILDPAADAIDNDDDGAIDGGDANTEAVIGGTPPIAAPARTITFDSTTSSALAQIDPGTTVTLYYRVDPDDLAAPGQILNNSVVVDYDSLAGASGSQDAPQQATSTAGGARAYPSLTDTADIDLLVPTAATDSKSIDSTSLTVVGDTALCTPDVGNTFCTGIGAAANNIQNVSIGEEVLFRLEAGLPAATYNNLIIRDELPAGLDCIEAPVVGLNPGFFSPDTEPIITCNGTTVEWDFGSRIVTALPTAPLIVTFIARVENITGLQAVDNDVIRNGGTGPGSTNVVLEFDDPLGNSQQVNLGPADLTIAEPLIVIDKSFGVVTNADAGDVLTVTVTATNNGTAPAYNLQVLDDLDAVANLTYVAGTQSAAVNQDIITLGANRPIFTLNPAAAIPPGGGSVSFTYNIVVDDTAQPLDVLNNTLQAVWTSLPDVTTALNTSGNIGANGAADGMRNGALLNAGNPPIEPNDYEVFITNADVSVLAPVLTKVDDNPAEIPTIGASKRFTVTIQLPDGTIPNLNLSDILNGTGTGFIYDDTTINYTFNNIASVNGVVAGDESNFVARPVNGVGGTINWITGPIVTNINDDIGNPSVVPEIIIEYNARINNDLTTDVADTLENTVNLDFSTGTIGPVTVGPYIVVEPQLSVTKIFNNVTPGKLATDLPDAGDNIEYVVTVTNASLIANASDAFDLNIVDTLPAEFTLDPLFVVTATIGGVPVPGFVDGPDNAPAGPLVWGQGKVVPDGSLDIPPAESLILTYRVILANNVQPNLSINNSVSVDWTSLEGGSVVERTGVGCPVTVAPNDYCVGPVSAVLDVIDNNAITKARLVDTSPALNAANDVRIGDVVDYELRLRLIEGTNPGVVLVDTLPQGLMFEGVISINTDLAAPYSTAAPFSYPADIPAVNIVAAGNPIIGPTTVTWNLGDILNAADNNAANDELIITYRARVLNLVQAQVNDINLINNINFDYGTATGPAVTEVDNETVRIQQPDLTVTKAAAPAGGDIVIDADELITYTVQIQNTGTAPAYDLTLRDTIPVGLRNGTATISNVQMSLLSGPVLTPVNPVYNAATGIADWNLDSGVADEYNIPAGDTLVISYDVQAESAVGTGLIMSNAAQVQLYYSFDDDAEPVAGAVTGVREIYGPSNTAVATVNTAAANPLTKANPLNTNISIGAPFTYRITIPDVAQPNALHDVRILDDLTLSAADMAFVNVTVVSASIPFTPVNTGTATNIVIEDLATGIEVPANEQIVVDITVQLRNQPVNVAGLLFNNTASYTTNMVDNDNATQAGTAPVTTVDMIVVEPTDMTLTKTGPATLLFGTPGVFTLDVQNIGTGPAFDLTVTDVLPNPVLGGMCDIAPNNFTARIFMADGVTPVSAVLVEGVDYMQNFAGDPVCTLSITMLTPAASMGATERLIISYEATLDVNNLDGTALTNVAAATEWFSADTAGAGAVGEIRTYTRVLTNGTTALLDHEDAHTVLTQSSILSFIKSVFNVTSATAPAVNAILPAEPGDTIEYTLTVTNTGVVGATAFEIVDEPDRLTSPPGLFDNTSINVTASPAGSVVSIVSGVLTVSNLNLGPAGAIDDSLSITFEITFLSVLPSGSLASNQAVLRAANFTDLLSDDPNINGIDDPLIFGDEDLTQTLIGSVPSFRVEKTSADISGDTNILVAGDTLRYNIEVQNIGLENAVNTIFRDQIPANTSYVASSATLNGVPLADPATGISPFQDGVLINAPEDTTPGNLRAEVGGTTNIAIVTFDVVVSTEVINGTVISNQGFVLSEGESSGAVPTTPSDNPDTTGLPNDPTQDVIGNFPILDAQKTVDFVPGVTGDVNADGIINSGEQLRYTIAVTNAGVIDASNVTLQDTLPADVTYLANTTFLNGLAVGQPDAGVFPFAISTEISSSNLTPPLPTVSNGIVSAGQVSTVTFDVLVNAVPVGTLISNTGTIESNELPDEETDADGNEENGDQPTIFIVGEATAMSVTKEVVVVGGGLAQPNSTLEYIISVANVGSADTTNVIVTDVVPVNTSYVAGSARLNGVTAVNGAALTEPGASLIANGGIIEPGDNLTVSFRVVIDNGLAQGTGITNTASVDWTENNAAPVTDSATIDVGGAPGISIITGQVWHDTNFDDIFTTGVGGVSESQLENWDVDILINGILLDTVQTNTEGIFTAIGLTPGGGNAYSLVYRAPGAGANTALLGRTSSIFNNANALQQIDDINLIAGAIVPALNLPIDPDGIVYDSVLRTAVAGAQLTMINRTRSNQVVTASCFDDPNQATQTTLDQGFYKFDLNYNIPSLCSQGDEYEIQIQPPANGYVGTTSSIIPPVDIVSGNELDVANCIGNSAFDRVPTTLQNCETSLSALQPATSVLPRTASTDSNIGTDYYLRFLFGSLPPPGSINQIYNNHIPVDPELDEAIAISKVAGLLNVTKSQLVPYTITLTNTIGAPLGDLNVVDNFPAGFKYVTGSSIIQGDSVDPNAPTEPIVNGQEMVWENLTVNNNDILTIKMLLIVGSGVGEGEYVNTARVINSLTGEAASGIASATVRVIPDPTFDCTDIIGKVFDDENLNTYQDKGEKGLPGVQVATARGLRVTTDAHGRFHITCAVVPSDIRGSNFIMKVDDRSLPSGYRITTENPRVQRATRGKMLKFNFGAAIHRVVRLDLANGVFEKGTTKLRPQWQSRIEFLIIELQKEASILRLSYLGENEKEAEVDDRLDAIEQLLSDKWEALNCCYKLTIEKEVFWRKGHPSDRKAFE